jgi:GNAT superfamily N-acetyltransferase
MTEQTIRVLEPAEMATRIDGLAAILSDAVAHGASVNFMAGVSDEVVRGFWLGQLPGVETGERVLLVAEQDGRLIGTAIVSFAPQPNAPHRAEIGKMLVHSSARRQGLGRRLLEAAENAARDAGRTLLVLDTETSSSGDALYRSQGWTELGAIPGHSFAPDGRLTAATYFYKVLGEARRPGAL